MTSTQISAAVMALAAIGAAVAFLWQPVARLLGRREARIAMGRFRLQREQLEAEFVKRASSLGKPRGLRWSHCEWQDGVKFGRELQSGFVTALVGVNIRFEAIEGEDMEGVEAVSMVRDASALFHYHRGRWGTGGRALFNMNPADALSKLAGQIEPLEGPR